MIRISHLRRYHALAMLAGVLVAGAGLGAHDLWIEPSAFVAGAERPIAVRLRVGANLLGDPVARDPALIERFVAVDSTGTRPIPGPDGVDPAGVLRITAPGVVVIGYASKPTPIVIAAQKFNDYLVEEGLDAVIALRRTRNETQAAAHEEFSRCAKALVLSGPRQKAGDRALGFTLELIAEQNPYALSRGQPLTVRLLYKAKPLAGALVVAMNKRDPAQKLSARSAKDGRVSFALKDPGMWLIKAVHMTPAASGSSAEWTSFWASLTFELGGGAAVAPGQK